METKSRRRLDLNPSRNAEDVNDADDEMSCVDVRRYQTNSMPTSPSRPWIGSLVPFRKKLEGRHHSQPPPDSRRLKKEGHRSGKKALFDETYNPPTVARRE